ncbi:hypothetical protein OS175_03750 [Marinicella sp. S1101]|uniref:hypothetical protein n=1 Tax=Marinicella marina TaxID=2996016 RepID=UPI00226092E4|nr:hypothetical protein [Marinicella marina]MCX7552982.1 hypothetical protein [Marinicella marina]MDJ1139708.1 hypothetical protein [Marinicella marina]
MSSKNIKLSERQLAGLFQNQTVANTTSSDADDCLVSAAASPTRLNHVEAIANDHTAAQGMKASFALKHWSEVVSSSIEKSQSSWFKLLGFSSPLKTTMATAAFAVAFAFALPLVSQLNAPTTMDTMTYQTVQSTDDLINNIRFEGPADQLSRGNFDSTSQSKSKDQLFDASFG